MKFPRNAKIFRGQCDAAPFAGVFFLLLIFLTFNTALVYVPGLPVQFPSGAPPGKVLTIDARGRFLYGKEILTEEEFAKKLRAERQGAAPPDLLVIKADPALTNAALARVVELARELKLAVDLPGAAIALPAAEDMPGTANPSVVVAVDQSGQIYFEGQVTRESQLRARLATAAQKSREPLTLVVLADKAVPYEIITRLGSVARASGFRGVLLATRPAVFSPPRP